jgi:hypothetical protein
MVGSFVAAFVANHFPSAILTRVILCARIANFGTFALTGDEDSP